MQQKSHATSVFGYDGCNMHVMAIDKHHYFHATCRVDPSYPYIEVMYIRKSFVAGNEIVPFFGLKYGF